MPIERISTSGDPRLADYRDVPDGELVRARGLFVAEGRLVVRRVLEDPRFRIRSLLVNDAALRSLDGALDAATPVFVCDPSVFPAVTGFNIHRGCLALVERPPDVPLDGLLERDGILVMLEGVANADNVGGVFRNAAAFGAAGVVLSPTCCDPLYRKAIRTSMGAALRVPFARSADWPQTIARVRQAGFTVAALTPREPSIPLARFAASRPPRVALVLGAEGAGLSADTERAADVRVGIPIDTAIDSLNVAVAAGIALYGVTLG